MSELISVIVAVYNVEKYLNKCVESLLSQTYKNIEVILVDDGSTDNSGVICDQFASVDNRVKVVHKENGGLSDARNEGMEVATGEYIVFCDGDDWVEDNILDRAYLTSVENNVDVVIWGYYADFVDKNEQLLRSDIHSSDEEMCAKGDNAQILLQTQNLGLVGYAWNKLYRTSLITQNNFRFCKGVSLVEDMLFNHPVLLSANRVAFISDKGTHYMQRPRVTLGTKYYPNYFELKLMACRAREDLLKEYKNEEDKVKAVVSKIYMGAIVSSIRAIKHASNINEKEKKSAMKDVCILIDTERIWGKCTPKSFKEKCFVFLLQKRWFKMLLILPII